MKKRKSSTGKENLWQKKKESDRNCQYSKEAISTADETELNACDENLLQDTDARDSAVNDISTETLVETNQEQCDLNTKVKKQESPHTNGACVE